MRQRREATSTAIRSGVTIDVGLGCDDRERAVQFGLEIARRCRREYVRVDARDGRITVLGARGAVLATEATLTA